MACCMKKQFLLYGLMLATIVSVAQSSGNSSGFYNSFDGKKIYYESAGNGSVVVLVHGFTGTSAGWKRSVLYNDLLKKGYRVIVMDLRGNGQSDKPNDAASYAHDAEAKDVMGLLTHLGIKKYAVAGYSRGSIITARLLVLDKRITKAVLGGMGTGFTDPEWPRRLLFYHTLAGDTMSVDMEGFMKYVKDSGFDRQVLAMQQKEQPSTSKKELGKIKQPVLAISGSEDSDNGSAEELAKLFKRGVYKTVPGNHNSTSGTAAYADAVITFLEQK